MGYAKRLRTAGVPKEQAEAHAEAAREFIMAELVTKPDLLATKAELQAAIDTLTLHLTVRLGGMIVVGVGALAILIRLQ